MPNLKELCPCASKKPYTDCCGIFHAGKNPKTALELMRSRFSAYAKHLPDYIIQTTHPESVLTQQDRASWERMVREFCSAVSFEDLKILNFIEKGGQSIVIFFASLKQGKEDISFSEKSYFKKEKQAWLYLKGEVQLGYHPEKFTLKF